MQVGWINRWLTQAKTNWFKYFCMWFVFKIVIFRLICTDEGQQIQGLRHRLGHHPSILWFVDLSWGSRYSQGRETDFCCDLLALLNLRNWTGSFFSFSSEFSVAQTKFSQFRGNTVHDIWREPHPRLVHCRDWFDPSRTQVWKPPPSTVCSYSGMILTFLFWCEAFSTI